MPTPSDEPPFNSRDELRRFALDCQREHDPAQQADNPYERCALCHYTSHPCDAYDMATMVLALIDQGQPERGSDSEPIRCEHGRTVAWKGTAHPGDRLPEVEHCEQCNPGAVELER